MKRHILLSVVSLLSVVWAAPVTVRAAGSLPPPASGGLRAFISYSLSYYSSYTTNFNFLLLYPDGTVFRDVPHKPTARFDAATLRRTLDAGAVGQWKQSGETLWLTFPGTSLTLHKYPQGWREKPIQDKDSAYDTYFPIAPPHTADTARHMEEQQPSRRRHKCRQRANGRRYL